MNVQRPVTTRHPRAVRFDGTDFRFLKLRFLGGATYVAPDRMRFLRLGDREAVAAEYATCQRLSAAAFPVPAVEAFRELDDHRACYVERSVGRRTYGERFMSSSRTGRADDAEFLGFRTVVLSYAESQAHSVSRPGGLAALLLLDMALQDAPPRYGEDLNRALRRLEQRLHDRLWCPSQADLNPFNVLPGGVIDFELACAAPFGYDVITCLYFGHYWPARMTAYTLGTDQVDGLVGAVDEVARGCGLPPPSDLLPEFLLLKAIWATARDAFHRMRPTVDPDLWPWRAAIRASCVADYLAGRAIEPSSFTDRAVTA